MALSVLAIPAFADNYIWLVHDGVHAAVVDPGDAAPVFAVLEANNLTLVAILLTHHHADHVGGVPELLQRFPVPVFGPSREAIPTITHALNQDDSIAVPELGLTLQVLDVPGHTGGHIAYLSVEEGWLFCGDTLFAGGCGRLFEGTPAQMVGSLSTLARLPDGTQVYCAHEYTMANLRFAQEIEPGNAALAARVRSEQAKRDRKLPTIPSTIGVEKATNPFLRHAEPAIIERLIKLGRLARREPIDAFVALREWKNSYK